MQDTEGAFSSPYCSIHFRLASAGPHLWPSWTILILHESHDKENKNTKIKILTVLGIDGNALNSDNQETKGKALSQLSTRTITIDLPNQLDNESICYESLTTLLGNTVMYAGGCGAQNYTTNAI